MTTSAPRSAIVTGASSGIGAAIATVLAARGFAVALGGRRTEKLSDVAKQIESAGGRVAVLAADLADAAAVDAFFDAAEAAIGPVDVLVNNAGVCVPGLLQETSPEAIQAEIATNLVAPALLARRAIASLLARGARGDLVFVSSENVVAPRPFQPVYTATKWGLEGLARTLRLELDGTGIRSVIVRPGPTFPTDFARGWDPGLVKRLLESWKSWGLQRHLRWMPASAVAEIVATIATAPAGVQFDVIQLGPEAPAGLRIDGGKR
ncbi:MAG: SDR family NAD(P)-dependent oxidoreductase [Myxococcota bacterium]|jgi:NAD(P)-dependent dehydrogenase (short-subunit alcohol dehydrogenase family)|nr:SDR family NAD(P)-dependent oxidoreductase [Myxococcota bacterium]